MNITKTLIEAIENENFEIVDSILEKIVKVKRVKACPPGETRNGTFCVKLRGKDLEKRQCLKTPGMKWDDNRCIPMNGKEKRLAKLRAKKAGKTKKKNNYKTVIKLKK